MTDRGNLLFQLAAGLIPVFLLAVAASTVLKPERYGASARRWLSVLVGGGAFVALVAEVFAIELSFAEDVLNWKAAIVIAALVFAVAATGLIIVWPWVEDLPYGRMTLAVASLLLATALGTYLANALGTAEKRTAVEEAACLEAWTEREARDVLEAHTAAARRLVAETNRQADLLVALGRASEAKGLGREERRRQSVRLRLRLRASHALVEFALQDLRDATERTPVLRREATYEDLLAASGCSA